MYYSYNNTFRSKTYHFEVISFLFATFFLNISGLPGFAQTQTHLGTTAAQEYRSLGYQAQQEGDFDRALTFYAKAIALNPDDAWIYNNVGVIYEQMGLPEKAELQYLKALEIQPDYLPSYTNLAFLYKERGDTARAISYFRTRIDRALDDDEWVPLLVKELYALDPEIRETIVQDELKETGERLYQMAQEELSLDVARADGHYRRAKEFVEQHQFKEALAEVDKAQSLTPNNPKLQERRETILRDQRIFELKERARKAMELLDSGDMDSARQEFQKILTILPGEPVQE